jgi:hypothetical protein
MGGIGSGRWGGGSRYLAAEQCYGLDLAALKRAGHLRPGAKVDGPWEWTCNGDPDTVATVHVEIDLRELDAPTFVITYKAGDELIEIRDRLLITHPRLGGVRYWFACPRCRMPRRVLYAHPGYGRNRFACRRCHGLRYYSHRESRPDRLCRKARKLWKRAGSDDGREPWEKPKWMRWETFSRLVLAGRAAQEEGDSIILGKLGAGLARIQSMHRRGSSPWH